MNPRLPSRRSAGGRRQRGSAAVEFAVLLPCLAIVLAPLILCARFMWHYTVAHKAAQDAARYMATVPIVEMRSRTLAARASAVAVDIASKELGDLAPGEELPDADVLCDTNTCGVRAGVLPRTIKVTLVFYMHDPIFKTYLGEYGLPIDVTVVTPYVGK
jgi:Flp pilus assembly protein TadG